MVRLTFKYGGKRERLAGGAVDKVRSAVAVVEACACAICRDLRGSKRPAEAEVQEPHAWRHGDA